MTTEPEPEPLGVSGKPIVLFFVAVLAIAAVVVVAYKIKESGLPPARMEFSRSNPEAAAAANATIHPLDAKAVRAETTNMDDYLKTAVDPRNLSRNATATDRLVVEQLVAFVQRQTGEHGPVVFVAWSDAVVRISWSGA